MVLFVVALILVLRPLAVIISTINTELSFKERLFIGLIGPRGVVCVAVAGLFAPMMINAGYMDANLLIPCIFLIVFSTVLFSGFLMKPIGKYLGVITPHENELLFVGASSFTIKFSKILKDNNVPVQIIDHTWRRLKPARQADIKSHYGEVLSLSAEHRFDFDDITHVIAASGNSAYNSLVCAHFAHDLGEKNVLQLATEKGESDSWSYHEDIKGKTLISSDYTFDKLLELVNKDWRFMATRLTDKFTYDNYQEKNTIETTVPVMKISDKGVFKFAVSDGDFSAKSGDLIIAITCTEKEVKID